MPRPHTDNFNRSGGGFSSELGYWARVLGDGPDLIRVVRVDGDYLEGKMLTKSYRVPRKNYVPQWKKGYE
jgi:hypothetical protein